MLWRSRFVFSDSLVDLHVGLMRCILLIILECCRITFRAQSFNGRFPLRDSTTYSRIYFVNTHCITPFLFHLPHPFSSLLLLVAWTHHLLHHNYCIYFSFQSSISHNITTIPKPEEINNTQTRGNDFFVPPGKHIKLIHHNLQKHSHTT